MWGCNKWRLPSPLLLVPLLGDLITSRQSLAADRTVRKCNITLGLVFVCVCVCVIFLVLAPPTFTPIGPFWVVVFFFSHVKYSFHARLLPLEFTAILSTVHVILSVCSSCELLQLHFPVAQKLVFKPREEDSWDVSSQCSCKFKNN